MPAISHDKAMTSGLLNFKMMPANLSIGQNTLEESHNAKDVYNQLVWRLPKGDATETCSA